MLEVAYHPENEISVPRRRGDKKIRGKNLIFVTPIRFRARQIFPKLFVKGAMKKSSVGAILIFCVTIILTHAPATADPSRNPVRNFSLAGVKLGMTGAEVITAMKNQGFDLGDAVRLSCARDLVEAWRSKQEPKKNCVSSLYYGNKIQHKTLSFELLEDFPSRPGRSVVTLIRLEDASIRTNADVAAAESLIKGRIGMPSYHIYRDVCDDAKCGVTLHTEPISVSIPEQPALLVILNDVAQKKKINRAISSYVESQQSGKVSL